MMVMLWLSRLLFSPFLLDAGIMYSKMVIKTHIHAQTSSFDINNNILGMYACMLLVQSSPTGLTGSTGTCSAALVFFRHIAESRWVVMAHTYPFIAIAVAAVIGLLGCGIAAVRGTCARASGVPA